VPSPGIPAMPTPDGRSWSSTYSKLCSPASCGGGSPGYDARNLCRVGVDHTYGQLERFFGLLR
jgi:hypothetical protein